MQELLVTIACLYQKGCTDTANLYYQGKPELQAFVAKVEREGRAIAGPVSVNYVLPIVGYAGGAKAVIKLYGNYSAEISYSQTALTFNKGF